MKKDYFEDFNREIEIATNEIQLKKAVSTERKGKAKLRDRLVFAKTSWTEALSFVAIIQSVVIFTALIPNSVETVNGFLEWFGIPFQFPLELSSVGAIVFIIFVFLFGLVAMRHIGTARTAQEISAKMNPGILLLYDRIRELEKKIDDKEKNNESKGIN